jgi:hypothetical protein
MAQYPFYKRLDVLKGLSGKERKTLSPQGFDFRIVQPVVSISVVDDCANVYQLYIFYAE